MDTTNRSSIEMNDVLLGAAGATGVKTATASVAADGVAQSVALRPASTPPASCTLTVDILQNATVLATGSATIASATTTLVTTSLATPAVSFVAGDRLKVRVTQPASPSCATSVHYDGTGVVSKLAHPQ